MSEIVQDRNVFHRARFYQILRGSGTKWRIISILFIICVAILKYLIYFLEYISKKLKTLVGHQQIHTDSGTQTSNSQDLMETITHHFGALHEENYIKSIVYKNQWNKMNWEISLIKEQLHSQCDCLNSFKEEIKELSNAVKSVQKLIAYSNDHNKTVHSDLCLDQKSFIPPAPPLPPPGFICSNTGSCVFRVGPSSKNKRMFEENCPPRPLITVESLKEVKLKKVPSPRTSKDEEKEEEKDLFPNQIKNLRRISDDLCKRPKTADCLKIKQKTNMTISPPRPLTSDS